MGLFGDHDPQPSRLRFTEAQNLATHWQTRSKTLRPRHPSRDRDEGTSTNKNLAMSRFAQYAPKLIRVP